MNITRIADELAAEVGEEPAKPDDKDVDLFLREICSPTYDIQRSVLMDCLRDDLEDQHSTALVMAAYAEYPTSPGSLDALSIIVGIIRKHARDLLEKEVHDAFYTRGEYEGDDFDPEEFACRVEDLADRAEDR